MALLGSAGAIGLACGAFTGTETGAADDAAVAVEAGAIDAGATGDGALEAGAKSEGGGTVVTANDGCGDGGSCVVFATDTVRNAGFGGTIGGDSLCAKEALQARLGGEFIAWLSNNDVGYHAADRLVEAGASNFVLVNGDAVAPNLTTLLTTGPIVPIAVNATGSNINSGGSCFVWTGTLADGGDQGCGQCDDWYDEDASANVMGRVGLCHQKLSPVWTDNNAEINCNMTARLYCFQIR
jgi:hypothetical protein